ncbi:peptidase M52 [Thalassobaculum fulvum]|uniref:Peptidase M52 n=1 Tax=Thalassobaculum fulvum TaxID=1633335 RepID=A0A918XWL4_9PROT|nr:hydrogenase maturation protease [Thalassobaculum fulvum]GHD60483.1 peptidase M52 [Thalassobaculum fulvum]
MSGRRIVIGIGNPDRGDDGVGRLVARSLDGRLPADVEVVEADGEATALLAHMDGAEAAYLVDACASGAEPGTVRRFDAAAAPLPQAAFGLSTHGFGLAEAIELARALRQLPARCVVYAIEGAGFETGAPLSDAVAEAIPQVQERLCCEIEQPADVGS